MGTQTETNKPLEGQALFAKMVIDGWNQHIARVNDYLANVTDEQLMKEASPGRNRGVYLLGHLTAVHDDMIRLLGFGEKLYPQLAEPFIKNPDKSAVELPPVSEVRKYWTAVNENLARHIGQLQPADWFTRHTAVLEEDFAKEPHRNKLNILLGRANHLNYHFGQLAFLKEKK